MIATEEKTIRLNLGGRDKEIPGFTTVDLSELNTSGIRTDASDLSMFEDNSVSEIYASQILEHFPHLQTVSVLKEWHRVLRPGAKITIGVPDFARAIEIYTKVGLCDWVVNFLYGDQIYDKAFHYAPFNFARLASLLDSVGFRDIKRISVMPYGNDCSSLVSNVDNRNVSLNVEAYK